MSLPRSARCLAVAITAGGGIAAAVATGSPALAAPNGWVTQISCTSMSGSTTYTPGLLTARARQQTAVVTATVTGCSGFGTSYAGSGTFSAQLAGSQSAGSGTLSGTFVINWPAASGFNPTVGTVTVNSSSGQATLQGATSATQGAFEGSSVGGGWFVTGKKGAGTKAKPITKQTFVATVPLAVSHNLG